jgi:integrase
MRVRRLPPSTGNPLPIELLDDHDQPIAIVTAFLGHLHARDYSPNTRAAYAYDLLHFFRFLARDQLTYLAFTPVHALALLAYLRSVPRRTRSSQASPTQRTSNIDPPAQFLAATSINRILAAVSSFYEFLILTGQFPTAENPIQSQYDPVTPRVAERHRPFMGPASRQRPVRRVLRVKTVQRLPRPLSDEQLHALFAVLRTWRDKAMLLLMLQGGLRPGEVLNLHLEDIQYGRRRIIVRYRSDHPRGARTKSRTERVVDLHDPDTLKAINTYIMQERPPDAELPLVFLVGGHGRQRLQALSYQALVRLFQRACRRAGIRAPLTTPHALRHTHATQMWEGGMRELALQKRLGHASAESTRHYTRVSDAVVLAEYRRALGEEESG